MKNYPYPTKPIIRKTHSILHIFALQIIFIPALARISYVNHHNANFLRFEYGKF